MAGSVPDTGDAATVSAAEIARLAGVGRAAVSNWRRRYGDFPEPVGGTDTSPSFDLREVRGWLERQGKLVRAPSVESVWQLMDAARGRLDAADAVAFAGAALLVATSERDTAGMADTELDDRIRAVFTAVPDTGAPELPPVHTFRETLDALAELAREEGGPQEAFERLYERFLTSVTRQFTATPDELAELMVDLAGRPEGTVFDPACGAATLLRTALLRGRGVRPVGQEANAGLARIGVVRLALAGTEPDIRAGDSLREDAFPDLHADAVLVNPPFNQRDWGVEALEFDARWEYGLPAKGDSELAWVQHALARARPGGAVVVVLPPGVASRRSGRRIRAELLRRGALRAVVALPAGLAPPMGIPLTVWVLRRPAEGEPAPSDVLVVDAATTIAEPAWPEVREAVLDAYEPFAAGRETGGEEAGYWRAVPVVDLLGEDVDLTPARHLTPAAPDVSGLGESREALAELAGRLPGLLPEVTEESPGSRATVTVHDLVRRGQLELLRAPVHRRGEEDTAAEAFLAFTLKEVLSGGPPSQRIPEGADTVRVRAGDVLVPRIVTNPPAARVVGDTEAGTPVAEHVAVLRPALDALDPWFLAAVFSDSDIRRYSATLRRTASFSFIEIRRVELPRLPLPEQRRIGAAFRRLQEFRDVLKRLSRTGDGIQRTMIDGLIHGALRPAPDDPGSPSDR
ncbi:N-6 DNA methylase [Halostreptopolyspora alba]|uniref:SAM-dependent methyltransferase n=1 Tax=Halostreptopolyspora alba TaxID=2487137 RepID=A0A3N0E8U1_9ACTN|nr:SAM-dependent methyltransferase [Nocardiopsaceae bacterium YIM 96095]